MWGDGCGGALSLFLEKLPGIPNRQADSGGNKLNDNAAVDSAILLISVIPGKK